MEASNISRLQEEQQNAISATDDQMRQLEKYKTDYKTLQKRLETLPDKVTHDVMVPFGKLAFMPGQLVHTNEILVLLGDNWFVEQSAKQARDIAGRRITELEKRLAELKEQKDLLEPRLGITSELQAAAEGKGDYKEIVEEYNEEKERLWDEQHKVNVRRHHEKMRKMRNSSTPDDKGDGVTKSEAATPVPPMKGDDDLWSRLDALEKQEEERGELNSSSESDNDTEGDRGHKAEMDCQRERKVSPTRDKRVNWMDDEDDKNDDEDYDDDDDDDDTDSDEEIESKPIIKTITFQHTKAPSILSHDGNQKVAASQDGACPNIITSPGDIYKLFSPSSILKKTPESRASGSTVRFPDNSRECCFSSSSEKVNDASAKSSFTKPVDTMRDKAFTGIVKENTKTHTAPSPAPMAQEQPKRISKFKAQRMGRNH